MLNVCFGVNESEFRRGARKGQSRSVLVGCSQPCHEDTLRLRGCQTNAVQRADVTLKPLRTLKISYRRNGSHAPLKGQLKPAADVEADAAPGEVCVSATLPPLRFPHRIKTL